MESLLTAKELAELISVKVSTIYFWTHTEMIPHLKISRNCIRFRLSDVVEWLKKKEVKGRTTLRLGKQPQSSRGADRPLS